LYVQYAACDENDDEEVEGEQEDYGCNIFFLFWMTHTHTHTFLGFILRLLPKPNLRGFHGPFGP
jgi:hypothetical protein